MAVTVHDIFNTVPQTLPFYGNPIIGRPTALKARHTAYVSVKIRGERFYLFASFAVFQENVFVSDQYLFGQRVLFAKDEGRANRDQLMNMLKDEIEKTIKLPSMKAKFDFSE